MKKPNLCTNKIELELSDQGIKLIAGVDEVGRGALAGPVLAAAVILDLDNIPNGLNDSKKLSVKVRNQLASEIKDKALAFSIVGISALEIDQTDIHQASLKAMFKAIEGLKITPEYILVDGFSIPKLKIAQRAIIKGDSLSVSIAAASIVAKVARDEIMQGYDLTWPSYGFAKNVGYGTAKHLASLRKHGASSIHRKTFHGVLEDDLQELLPLEID
ncbi:MAG: ribonuclease HII [Acidobacteria bacterium]|nr:ribonuclease HII [Acidobacteriota bacterium]